MSWLLTELWGVLLAAFALGAVFGWLLRSGLAFARVRAHRDDQARLSAQQSELQRLREALAAQAERAGAEAPRTADTGQPLAATPEPVAAAAEAELRLAEAAARMGALQAEIAALRARQEGAVAGVVTPALEQALAAARQWQQAAQSELDTLRSSLLALQSRETALHACVAGLRTQLDGLRSRSQTATEPAVAPPVPSQPSADASAKPESGPAHTGDNLRLIRGVGPKIESLLHGLGIRWYQQIAHADAAELDRIAQALPGFAQRVRREDWPGQCRERYREKYGRLP